LLLKKGKGKKPKEADKTRYYTREEIATAMTKYITDKKNWLIRKT